MQFKFYNAIIEAKEAFANGGEKTYQNLEEITTYIDFRNVVREVELTGINVTHPTYIALYYRSKEDDSAGPTIDWDRGAYGNDYDYIEEARKRQTTNPKEINYNGNIIIMEEVYYEGTHVCNQYFWVEDGYNIHVVVPTWLLKLYPEETFYNVKVVNVPEGKYDPTLLSVTSGGETIYPMKFLNWSTDWRTWSDGDSGWLHGDSFYWHGTSFEDYCDEIPSVTLSKDITISHNPGFFFAISEGEPARFPTENGENFTYKKLNELPPGTYYVRLETSFKLEYIPGRRV